MTSTATAQTKMETVKVLLLCQATRVIAQHRCLQCARQTWVVTLAEAYEIWAGGQHSMNHPTTLSELPVNGLHQVKTTSGAEMICLNSLFPNAFHFIDDKGRTTT